MAFTESEERRVRAVELKLNDVQTALNNLATREQLKQLLNIRQSEIAELQEKVVELEQRILDLENA